MISISRGLAHATAVVAGLVVTAGDLSAQESALGAHLGATLAGTDNVTLASVGSEQNERLVAVEAGINFSRSQARLETDVGYQVQGLFYDQATDADEVFHQLNANGRFAMVLGRLFLDFLGVYDQTLADPTGKYSVNNLTLTGNRTDVAIVGISPNLLLAFGDNIAGELRVGTTNLDYDDPEILDTRARTERFGLANADRRRGVAWGFEYNRERYEYDFTDPIEFETFEGEIGRWFGTTRLFTTQGLESDYTLLGSPGQSGSGGLDEHFWYVGVDWRPNERSALELSVGERNFGNATRFAWNRQTRDGSGVSIGYTEEPNTFLRQQLNSIRRVGELAPIDSLDGPTGNRLYVQERLDVGFALNRARSNFGLRYFQERRFDIDDAVVEGAVGEETEEFSGFELSWGWQFDSRSTLGTSMQRARRFSSFSVVDDELSYVTVTWRRRMTRTLEFLVTASRQTSDPQSSLGEALPYEENQLTVGVTRTYGVNHGTRLPQRYSDYANTTDTR